jgi:hypothetical protein
LIYNNNKVSGRGLALTAVVLEQDAAYWEVHVVGQQQQQQSSSSSSSEAAPDAAKNDGGKKCNAMFGVATKKDRQFYNALEEASEDQGKIGIPFV